MIFLFVLKWIGIVLLFFLGLILLMSFLVFFFPFVYRISAEKKEEFKAKASLSFLFRILYVSIIYVNQEPLLVARFLGIPVYKTNFDFLIEAIKESNVSSVQAEDDSVKTDMVDSAEDEVQVVDSTSEDEITELSDEELDEEIKNVMEEEEPPLTFKQKLQQFFEKIKLFISNCKKKCYNIKEQVLLYKKKTEHILKNIKYYYKVLNHPAVKPAWNFLLKHLKKMWRNARPRKVRVNIVYGASDPAQTAKIYGYYCMIYPFYGKSIRFEPNLSDEVFLIDGKLRGRFQVYRFILSGLAIFMNRNCRKVVKLLMREVKKRGRK